MAKNLEFIVGTEDKVAPIIYVFYKENKNKIKTFKFYMNNVSLSNPKRIKSEKDEADIRQYGKFFTTNITNLETLVKINRRKYMNGVYEIIKAKDEKDVYEAIKMRINDYIKEVLGYYLNNLDKIKIELSSNWKDLISK
mgnify:CR=1 FL=1